MRFEVFIVFVLRTSRSCVITLLRHPAVLLSCYPWCVYSLPSEIPCCASCWRTRSSAWS